MGLSKRTSAYLLTGLTALVFGVLFVVVRHDDTAASSSSSMLWAAAPSMLWDAAPADADEDDGDWNYTLTLKGRLFYNETDCQTNEVSMHIGNTALSAGEVDYIDNSTQFSIQARPNHCFYEDTQWGGPEVNWFKMTCENDVFRLLFYESEDCTTHVGEEIYNASSSECNVGPSNEAGMVTTSSCDGTWPADALIDMYSHTAEEEKAKFAVHMYENREFLTQRLEDKGIKASTHANELAALYTTNYGDATDEVAHVAKQKAEMTAAGFPGAAEAMEFFRNEKYSPYFWEYLLQTYPLDDDEEAGLTTKQRKQYVAGIWKDNIDSYYGEAVDGSSIDDYASYGCTCGFAGVSGSFLFFTWGYSISECSEGSSKWGVFEESSFGIILGLELGASMGTGMSYFNKIESVSGESWTMSIGGFIDLGVDIDVTMGVTYVDADVGSEIIGIYAGLEAGVSVGASIGTWEKGECYAEDYSGFDVDCEWSNEWWC